MVASKADPSLEGEYDPERHAGLYGAQRIKAMTAVLLALLLSILDYSVANVALPSIATDLHSDPSQAIWVVNAYQLANLSCLLPLAALGARIGFGRMSQIGILLFLVASAACALSHTMLEITLARALQGIGGSCVMSVNIALVRFIYPHKLLGRGIAINGLFVGLGVALGPTIGSFILSVSSWPWIFWVNLPLGGVAFILSSMALPKTPQSALKVDIPGSLLTVASFALTGIGLDSLMHGDVVPGIGLTVGSIVCWALLLRWQRHHVEPIVPLDLLKRGPFLIACLVAFSGFVASNLYIVAMPFTLTEAFHRNPATVGLLIAPWAVGVASMSFIVGRVADRFPASMLSSLGLLVTAMGFVLLWTLSPEASNSAIAWRTLVAGLGFGLFQPPNNRAIMVTAPPGREGGASGMLSVSRLSGQTTGALLVAGLFTIFPHPAFICLGAAACVAASGALLSAARAWFKVSKAS
ncbi:MULTISPECIES: MFS transporter [unclassified Saccharibacter]|uniref:MFS transporter n=1 Tax=unclassified Saccharibacter TaxID=2648722 RepID=UPI0013276C2C|nr:MULTISPECIES: MFS transporter [unclassified Saccharibacter]MXV35368.1 MFS transporter [Saccharibacter sp. EH611]MXV57784.1 MFS transporter [Saccharibacter sp. EH70]MXV65302.1 MFS transporter [Saccharibacter sp. EH60]